MGSEADGRGHCGEGDLVPLNEVHVEGSFRKSKGDCCGYLVEGWLVYFFLEVGFCTLFT